MSGFANEFMSEIVFALMFLPPVTGVVALFALTRAQNRAKIK